MVSFARDSDEAMPRAHTQHDFHLSLSTTVMVRLWALSRYIIFLEKNTMDFLDHKLFQNKEDTLPDVPL